MAYDLTDIARESVTVALERAGIGSAELETLAETGDLERFVAAMVVSTVDALEWGAKALSASVEPDELRGIAVVAVFDVVAALTGATPDAVRLAALVYGAAEWAGFENLSDEMIRAALEEAAGDLGLEMRPGRDRDVVDEAGTLLGKIVGV